MCGILGIYSKRAIDKKLFSKPALNPINFTLKPLWLADEAGLIDLKSLNAIAEAPEIEMFSGLML